MLKKVAGAAFSAGSSEVKAKYQGNKDYLEAVCAAAALIAAADGDIEDAEVKSTIELIKNNDTLSAIYQPRDIEDTMARMLAKAKGMAGRIALKRELQDIRGDATKAEDVFAMACDVSMSDGEMEPQEVEMLKSIAQVLGLDPKRYGIN
jgi:tellurite resistance protein